MARLPIPGDDNGTWGTILNDYLSQSLKSDGTLKDVPLSSIPDLHAVAVSGSYNDLDDLPEATQLRPTLLIASDAPQAWKDLPGIQLAASANQGMMSTAINQGPVILSPGTFNLSAPISITAENPHIVGSGWSSVIKIADGTNDWAITFTPPGNGVRGYFGHFVIDGNGSNQTAGGGIHGRGSVQSVYDFIHFMNCYDAGLWLDGFPSSAFGHHNKVVSCLFDNTLLLPGLGRGMLITSSDENHITSDFQFLGGSAGSTYAIRDQAGLNSFEGCVFVGGRNNLGGIELRDGQRSKVIGCTFDGVSGHNIFVASSSAHIITNNTLTSVADQASSNGTYSGIYLEYAVNQCLLMNNVLETSATAGRTHSLIREDNSGGTGLNIIKNNVLRPNGAGTPSAGYGEFNGTDSLVGENIINTAII